MLEPKKQTYPPMPNAFSINIVADLNAAGEILRRWKTRGIPLTTVAAIFGAAAEGRQKELDSLEHSDEHLQRIACRVIPSYQRYLRQIRAEVVAVQPVLNRREVYPAYPPLTTNDQMHLGDFFLGLVEVAQSLGQLREKLVPLRLLLNMYDVRLARPRRAKKKPVPLGDYLLTCMAKLTQSGEREHRIWGQRLGIMGIMELSGVVRTASDGKPPSSLRLPGPGKVFFHQRLHRGAPSFRAYTEAIFCLRELSRIHGVPHKSPRGRHFYWRELADLLNNRTLWALAQYFDRLSDGLAWEGPAFFLPPRPSSALDKTVFRFVRFDWSTLERSARERFRNKRARDPLDLGRVLTALASTTVPRSRPLKLLPFDALCFGDDVAPPRPFTPHAVRLSYERFKRERSGGDQQRLLRDLAS